MSPTNGAPGHAQSETAAPKKVRSMRVLISEYRFDPKMSRSQRLAHFLNWLAERAPYTVAAPNLALQAIMGYARTPNQNKDEVKLLTNSISAAREILMREYKRGLFVMRGVGMRATVDDQDCADTQQRRNVQRLMGAHRKVKETSRIIDPAKIEDDKLRSWIKGGVANALKSLDAEGRLDRLLPPPKPKEEER
jgi:hypothetical protein